MELGPEPGRVELTEARGEVTVPADVPVRLDVDADLPDLSPLAALPADALAALDLEAVWRHHDRSRGWLEEGLVDLAGLTGLRWLWADSRYWSDATLARVAGRGALEPGSDPGAPPSPTPGCSTWPASQSCGAWSWRWSRA